MPRQALRPCNAVGCNRLSEYQYCEDHSHLGIQRHKIYDQNYRDRRTARFYKSKEWLISRKKVLNRDHGLCQHCLKHQKITPADTVHHKVPLKVDWSRRLDLDNLESLCASYHNKVRA